MTIHTVDCTETHYKECLEYIDCKERFSCVTSDTCVHFNFLNENKILMCDTDISMCKPYNGALYKERV